MRVAVVRYPDRRHLVLRWTDAAGKQRTRSARTADRREAERAAVLLEAELAAAPATSATWTMAAARYVQEATELRPSTRESRSSLAREAEGVLGAAMAPTTQDLQRLVDLWRENGLAESTIGGKLAHLMSLITWAKGVGLVASVPERPKLRRARGRRLMKGRPITAAEFARLREAARHVRPADGIHFERLLDVLWWLGLRLSEGLILGWHAGPLAIDLSGRRPRLKIDAEHEKGHRDRLLPLTPDAARYLLATPAEAQAGLVCPGLPEANECSKAISAMGRAAKVTVNEKGKAASAHDLRRSFGTRWAPRVKPAVLQQLMRHASIETTMRFYVGLDADELGDELDAGEGPVGGPVGGPKAPSPLSAAAK